MGSALFVALGKGSGARDIRVTVRKWPRKIGPGGGACMGIARSQAARKSSVCYTYRCHLTQLHVQTVDTSLEINP